MLPDGRQPEAAQGSVKPRSGTKGKDELRAAKPPQTFLESFSTVHEALDSDFAGLLTLNSTSNASKFMGFTTDAEKCVGCRGRGEVHSRNLAPLVRGWNKLAAKAYYLAGGGPCIAIDAGPSSPRVGNTARSVGRPYWGPERRSVPRPGEVWDRPQDLGERPTAWLLGLMGGCGEICEPWRRSG